MYIYNYIYKYIYIQNIHIYIYTYIQLQLWLFWVYKNSGEYFLGPAISTASQISSRWTSWRWWFVTSETILLEIFLPHAEKNHPRNHQDFCCVNIHARGNTTLKVSNAPPTTPRRGCHEKNLLIAPWLFLLDLRMFGGWIKRYKTSSPNAVFYIYIFFTWWFNLPWDQNRTKITLKKHKLGNHPVPWNQKMLQSKSLDIWVWKRCGFTMPGSNSKYAPEHRLSRK